VAGRQEEEEEPIHLNAEGEGSVLMKCYSGCCWIPHYWLSNTNSQFHEHTNSGIRRIRFQFPIPTSNIDFQTEPIVQFVIFISP
jgi:hypothetical protein